jgi:hypothetical protein
LLANSAEIHRSGHAGATWRCGIVHDSHQSHSPDRIPNGRVAAIDQRIEHRVA